MSETRSEFMAQGRFPKVNWAAGESIIARQIPQPTARMKMADGFYYVGPSMPNRWHRFWQRVLLGWTWEKLSD
jgi:hypothetical protein